MSWLAVLRLRLQQSHFFAQSRIASLSVEGDT